MIKWPPYLTREKKLDALDLKANAAWERLKDPEYYTRHPIREVSHIQAVCDKVAWMLEEEHGDSFRNLNPAYVRRKKEMIEKRRLEREQRI